MRKSGYEFYDESYYKVRGYEFDLRYPYFSIIAKTLVQKFNPQAALDIGCAKGYLVYALRDSGVEAYGVDVSQYAISQGPENVRDALFCVDLEVEQLPFKDEIFDLVTVLEVVEHLRNHNRLVSEIERVLKRKGVVTMSSPGKYLDFFLGLVGVRADRRFGPNLAHVNIHTKSFWIRTFELYGLNYIGSFPKEAHRQAVHLAPSVTKIAELMVKFGTAGRWLRDELALALQSEPLLFRKT